VFERILLLIAGIVGMMILIGFTITHIYVRQESEIEGNKKFVIFRILSECYKCFEKNYPSKKSVICNVMTFKSSEPILASDLINNVDVSKLDKSRFKPEDLGKNGKIIIRYENGIIFVEKI